MKFQKIVVSLCLATITVGLSANANAGSNNDIPASECSPASGADATKLDFTVGGWELASGQTGEAVLLCPVPNADDFNLVGPCSGGAQCDRARIDYQDTDGTGTASRVRFNIWRRDNTSNSATTIGLDFDSNDYTSTGSTNKTVKATDDYDKVDSQTLYAYVRLYRSSTSQTPRFIGLTWLGLGT